MDEHLQIEDIDVTNFVKLNIKCIEFFGYFCPQYNNRVKKSVYYFYSAMFVGFFYVLSFASEFANFIAVFGNIEKMTEASFVLLTHMVQGLKLYSFMAHGPEMRNLIKSMNRSVFKPQNNEQRKILMDGIEMSQLITRVFLFMCFVTCSLWGIFPLLDKSDADESIRLPLSGWYPFKTDRSPVFELVYIYQILATLATGMGNISMDTFLSGTIMVISGQLAILNNSLQTMGHQNRGDFKDNIIRNVIHYKNIVKFSNKMTGLFTTCIMGQFVVSAIIICITMFQMSLVSPLSLQFLSMILYQSCILLEIFLWCHYGNEVILKSNKLTESIYLSKWIDTSKDLKANLLIFMIRTQFPLKLYAGGYFTLSLDTFMAIAKSSWSYFAVLNSVHLGKS